MAALLRELASRAATCPSTAGQHLAMQELVASLQASMTRLASAISTHRAAVAAGSSDAASGMPAAVLRDTYLLPPPKAASSQGVVERLKTFFASRYASCGMRMRVFA